MSVKNIKTISIVVVIILFLGTVFVKPVLRKRDALRVVENVLGLWQSDEHYKAVSFWEDINAAPPIETVSSAKIISENFKRGPQGLTGEFVVSLDFPQGNTLPSGREWKFTVGKTKYGWKVLHFQMLN